MSLITETYLEGLDAYKAVSSGRDDTSEEDESSRGEGATEEDGSSEGDGASEDGFATCRVLVFIMRALGPNIYIYRY